MEKQRRNWLKKIGLALAGLGLAKLNAFARYGPDIGQVTNNYNLKKHNNMEEKLKLGAFSISLNVRDLKASREFYESLGFTVFGGSMAQHYLIMKSEGTLIGLFQGMFEKNLLTFNPGWDQDAKTLEKFDDVRVIQKHLKSKGIQPGLPADENTKGPASFVVVDPDGNQILFDQHI